MKKSMRSRLTAELGMLTDVIGDDDAKDEVVEALEMSMEDFDGWLDDHNLTKAQRGPPYYAFGYINGVAQDRDMTIQELLQDEELL